MIQPRTLHHRTVTTTATVVATFLAVGTLACRDEPVAPPPSPQSVTAVEARETDSARTLHLSGAIEADRSTPLGFAVPGTVQSVFVQEGESVSAGQLLARLESRSFRDALDMAKAKADQAEDAYRRFEPMHRNRTVPDVKWVEVETGVQQARAALSLAQKNLDDTVLRAAEAGVIARRNVEPGMTCAPGMPSFILVQTRTVLANVPVPESQIAGVTKRQRAEVVVGALGRTFEGRVREIGVVANPLTRSYEIKIAIPNADGALRVGMVAEVSLRHENESRTVVVPPAAVRVDENGQACVYVINEKNVLRRTPVQVSGFLGEGTALSAGVAPGERVVTSGTPMLADGMPVRVVERAALGRASNSTVRN
jgi:membrane fusion protein (multidrug efflux system)